MRASPSWYSVASLLLFLVFCFLETENTVGTSQSNPRDAATLKDCFNLFKYFGTMLSHSRWRSRFTEVHSFPVRSRNSFIRTRYSYSFKFQPESQVSVPRVWMSHVFTSWIRAALGLRISLLTYQYVHQASNFRSDSADLSEMSAADCEPPNRIIIATKEWLQMAGAITFVTSYNL